ncbi:MAG: DUF6364 family protein [Candidatus Kapabacteria bacterium]|jgi:hypothetical protein|nr:DUF6364 family protein [Candidatus Kapabacteria bacterium]
MDTELTIKLDNYLIQKANEYALSQQRSLSLLIESYLKSLIDSESKKNGNENEISPYIKSMRTGVQIPSDFDYKKDFIN